MKNERAPHPVAIEFGKEFARLVKERNYSTKEISTYAGIGESLIFKVKGGTRVPSRTVVQLLAELLDPFDLGGRTHLMDLHNTLQAEGYGQPQYSHSDETKERIRLASSELPRDHRTGRFMPRTTLLEANSTHLIV